MYGVLRPSTRSSTNNSRRRFYRRQRSNEEDEFDSMATRPSRQETDEMMQRVFALSRDLPDEHRRQVQNRAFEMLKVRRQLSFEGEIAHDEALARGAQAYDSLDRFAIAQMREQARAERRQAQLESDAQPGVPSAQQQVAVNDEAGKEQAQAEKPQQARSGTQQSAAEEQGDAKAEEASAEGEQR